MMASLKLKGFDAYKKKGVTPYGCEIDATIYRYKIINGKETFTGFEYSTRSDTALERKYNTKEDVINYWHNGTDTTKTFTDRVGELAKHYGIAWATAHAWLTKCGIKTDRTTSCPLSKEELQSLFNKHEGSVNAVRRELKVSSWNQVKKWLDEAGVKQVQASLTKESDCNPGANVEKQEPALNSISNNMSKDTVIEPCSDEEFAPRLNENKELEQLLPYSKKDSIQGKIEPHNIMDEFYINAKILVEELIQNDMALSIIKNLIRKGVV